MTNWMEVGTNVVAGGGAGAVDQLLQNQDEKRRRTAEAEGKKFSMWAAYGTYYNYGIPLLAVLNMAFGFIRGPWAEKMVLIGAQLAGRKATSQATKATQATPWREYRAASRSGPPVKRTYQPEFEEAGARAL